MEANYVTLIDSRYEIFYQENL